jgi:uncharacterized protein (TIGR02271 family)
MTTDDRRPQAIPLAQEQVVVGKRAVDIGKVRVRTSVAEDDAVVHDELLREVVTVERVPVDREVREIPQIRREGDLLIVPVVEERVFVEKRLVVTEELHIRTVRTRQPFEEPVTLRRTVVNVEREALDTSPAHQNPGRPE